jgi:cytochrome b561
MTKALRHRTGQFTATAKWLHWLVAFFMLSILPVAFGFAFLPHEDRAGAIPAHASIGFIVLVLTLVRLGWRASNPPPPVPEQSAEWTKRGAKLGHFLLYALILLQGLIGIWMAASSRVAIRLFNGFNLSSLAPANAELINAIRPLHAAGAWLLLLVLVGHVAGALWHHFKLRDDVLIRMLPFSGLWYRLTDANYAQRWRFPSSYLPRWPRRLSKQGDRL